MALKHIQPPDLFDSRRLGFTQVVTSPPGRLVFVSGQVAFDETLRVEGVGDLKAQTARALENLDRALRAADAGRSDVAFLRVYVANYSREHAGVVGRAIAEFFGDSIPAQTLLGVQSLATPDLLIELEAFAVVS